LKEKKLKGVQNTCLLKDRLVGKTKERKILHSALLKFFVQRSAVIREYALDLANEL
jgi:hypothetical protein